MKTLTIDSVTSIAHDLRNPLATIHGGAELLVHAGLSQPQVRRIAGNIYSAAIRMHELLEDLFDMSRDEEMEPSDLRELIANAVDKVTATAELQSVRIAPDVPEGLIVALHRRRIIRVLVNLLVNALEVMPAGGAIYISAVSEQRSAVVRVRDTGPGIPPEIQDRLFEPFATAGKADGLGLGLAFARQAVRDHGGEIWVEPSRRGACFALRLPGQIAAVRRLRLMPPVRKCAAPARPSEGMPAAALPARTNRRFS